MYVLLEHKGHQYSVREGAHLYIPFFKGEPDTEISFDKVLLLDTGKEGGVVIGSPYVNVDVNFKVVEHVKAKKCIVFKKKRRKGYAVKRGHRQAYTKIFVSYITPRTTHGT